MKLEEEIKQDKFESEYQKLIVNILFTGSWLQSISSKILKPHNVSSQQYNVLRILKGQFPNAVCINDITSRMIDKMSNSSRLVDKLKQKGLVERVVSKKDRRQVDVRISEKGIQLLHALQDEINLYEPVKSNLTEKEAILLNQMLDKTRG